MICIKTRCHLREGAGRGGGDSQRQGVILWERGENSL